MASSTSAVVCALSRSRVVHVTVPAVHHNLLLNAAWTRHQICRLGSASDKTVDCCTRGVVGLALASSHLSGIGRHPGRNFGCATLPSCRGLRLTPVTKFPKPAYRDHGRGHTALRPRTKTTLAVSTREEPPNQIYEGVYGKWTVEATDKMEVFLYRAGIVASSASFSVCSLAAFLPENDAVVAPLLRSLLDPLYILGAGGLGLSLFLIHVYVTEIKRFMQILWAVGCLGSLGLAVNYAAPSGEPLALYVLHHPGAVWAVGPLFASLTALVFKEGLCYGKLEAAALVFVIPGLLLGHLAGLDQGVEQVLLGTWVALYVAFAARKFTQPVKDDIGDKSVFIFNALPEEEKEPFMARLERERAVRQSGEF